MLQQRTLHEAPYKQIAQALIEWLVGYVNVTDATYTIKASDRIIGVNRAGVVTVTLPTALVAAGRRYIIKDESGAAAANNITVDTEGAELIDGLATDTINTNYGSMGYYSNSSNWFKV